MSATDLTMSGAGSSSSFTPTPCFLIFCLAAATGWKSATAAAAMNTSVAASWRCTAANMSRALSTLMRVMPAGVGRCTGPVTRVTWAPASRAAAATAKPIFPELRLVR